MPLVQIPGVGNVQFPDDMPPEAIQAEAARLHAEAQTPVAAPAAPPAPPGSGLGSQLGQGALMGFLDEARGAAGAAIEGLTGEMPWSQFPERYKELRDIERESLAAYEAQNPTKALVAQGLGGFGSGLLTGGAGALTGTGRAIGTQIARLPWWQRLAVAAPIGAAAGGTGAAVSAAGEAPELSDVPAAMAEAAPKGAAIGAALGPVGEGVMTAGQGLVRGFRAARDPARRAARNIERARVRSGLSPEEELTRAEAMGTRGSLADIDPAYREALETTTQQPGAARGMAESQLYARTRRQADDLLGDFRTGQREQMREALEGFKSEHGSPLYEQAFDQGVEHSPALEEIFETIEELAPGVWDKAKRFGRADLRNSGNAALAAQLGGVRPSLRGWQFVQRRLRSMANTARRTGDADEALILENTRARLLAELDEQNQTFREARRQWAMAKQFEETMDDARSFMTEPADVFLSRIENMDSVDRQAMRVGAIQAIVDRVERGQWSHDVSKLFRTPAMERKMAALFDDPRDYADFQSRLTAVTEQQRTLDAVRGQSATARRLAAANEANDWISDMLGSAAETVVMGQPMSAGPLAQAGRMASGAVKGGYGKVMRSEEARTETARQLLETDPVTRRLEAYSRPSLITPPRATGADLLPAVVPGAVGIPLGLVQPQDEKEANRRTKARGRATQ